MGAAIHQADTLPKHVRAKQYFIKGLLLEGVSLILIWILIAALGYAQQVCVSGQQSCTGWKVSTSLMSLLLVIISIFALRQFHAIPNNSVPPEKLVGLMAGTIGLITGIVIAMAVMSGYFV